MKPNKTSKKEFELFQKEADKWIKYFGLSQWEVHYKHHDIDELASCGFDTEAKQCTISFASNFGTNPKNTYEIRLAAFHEVCELLLVPLSDALYVHWSSSFIASRAHDIINRLQNTIFK